MADPTPQELAIRRINQAMEYTGYTFSDLRDRWEQATAEAAEWGDEYACIKIPSGSEFEVPTILAHTALGN